MNEPGFVDFEDVAVLGQSNQLSSPEVDQWNGDITFVCSTSDWSVVVFAQEVAGCVSERGEPKEATTNFPEDTGKFPWKIVSLNRQVDKKYLF